MVANDQERKWSDLFQSLKTLLSSHGKESPFGGADFWVVDDNWGGNLQKVCVFNMSFLTPALTKEVQHLIVRSDANDWGVMFSLELENSGEAVRTIPSNGIVVYADRIEEAWDRKRLKALLGPSFTWEPGEK